MPQKAVVALGGNALIKEGQEGNIHEQFANTREVVTTLVTMIQHGWELVITHGNGPQVGTILLQNNAARKITPPMPLGICVAESEGFIGYMVQQCLSNALKNAHISKPVATIITQVLIDQNDPAMKHPTKPIGPFYSEDEIDNLINKGYQLIKQIKGWRIVVPSPDPKRIIEEPIINTLLSNGIIVIAVGGGGMPVIEKEYGGLDGVEAVVDKDLASERLAEAIDADLLLILTNVDYVYIDYNSPSQKPLRSIALPQLKEYYQEGYFPEGSMGPKILSAIRFLEAGGKKVIICNVDKGWAALQGETGTLITKT